MTLSRSYVDVARKCLNHLVELPRRRIEAVEENCFKQQKDPYSFGFVVDHIYEPVDRFGVSFAEMFDQIAIFLFEE